MRVAAIHSSFSHLKKLSQFVEVLLKYFEIRDTGINFALTYIAIVIRVFISSKTRVLSCTLIHKKECLTGGKFFFDADIL